MLYLPILYRWSLGLLPILELPQAAEPQSFTETPSSLTLHRSYTLTAKIILIFQCPRLCVSFYGFPLLNYPELMVLVGGAGWLSPWVPSHLDQELVP